LILIEMRMRNKPQIASLILSSDLEMELSELT